MQVPKSRQIVSIGFCVLLIIGFLVACDCSSPDDITLAARIKSRLAAELPDWASAINVKTTGHVVTLSGVVDSDTIKSQAEQITKSVAGVKSVVNNLTVKLAASPQPLTLPDDTALKNAVEANLAKYGVTGITVTVANGEVVLTGDIEKSKLEDAMKAANEANPKKVNNRMNIIEAASGEATDTATQEASEALSTLKPGFTAQDLVNALNLSVINFASGSAEIPAESSNFLKKAAETIKSAPQGTVIEVGGHTDNTGNADANLELSQARAEAVRDKLVELGVNPEVLTAKGYGSNEPVASNDTKEGRFKNRRIEYIVVK